MTTFTPSDVTCCQCGVPIPHNGECADYGDGRVLCLTCDAVCEEQESLNDFQSVRDIERGGCGE
jgi:hypothetical protein